MLNSIPPNSIARFFSFSIHLKLITVEKLLHLLPNNGFCSAKSGLVMQRNVCHIGNTHVRFYNNSWRTEDREKNISLSRSIFLSLSLKPVPRMILILVGGLSLFTRHLQFIHLLKEASNDRLTEDKNKVDTSIILNIRTSLYDQ